ncbi:hypothetical protein [Polaromonas sp.]|uniref:hypothetical protein n=1 Tax=Polaromonas sp. TaxID=1869339 RepID=UPI0017AB26AD|nr:hypothetical protein [Polaromonas sp.]NMM06325.1 hypothetical protein [Polaromonas sp.]
MKHIASLPLALAIAASGASAWGASHTQQDAHHPAGSASAPKAKAMPDKSNPAMARTDAQIKAMQEMHDKMMAAKTPEERNALMTEHMKTMQNGMAMMSGMSSGAMAGMPGDANMRNQMMEKRMDMMQTMMQMMMDRLPAAPAK